MDDEPYRAHLLAEGIQLQEAAAVHPEPVAPDHRNAEGLEYHPDELPDERAYLGPRDRGRVAGIVEERLEEAYDISVSGLDLEFVDSPEETGYDPDAGVVHAWSSDGEADPEYLIQNAMMHIACDYDDALEDVVQRRLEVIEGRYPKAEGVEVSARFDSIEDAGQYDHRWKSITIDSPRSDQFYPASGVVEYPLRRLIDHEVAHAVHQQTSPATQQLSDAVAAETDGHTEYREHVGRAAIEAIATFEEDPGGAEPGSDNALPYLFLERSLGHTYDLITSRTDPADADDGLLFDDPYDLGRLTAVTIDAAYRSEHGDEEGRELARQTLLSATSPKGMEGMLGNGLRMLGMPDIPELLREEYERLRETGAQRYVEQRPAELAEEAHDPEIEELDRLFIETEAVREVASDLPYPLEGSFSETFRRVRRMHDRAPDTA